MEFRIGDRDPVTGLYAVIWPDGGRTINGIKIYNAAHVVGDVVMATQRSDGMMILDSVKAVQAAVVNTEFAMKNFDEKPIGYLSGQVFNNEEEEDKRVAFLMSYSSYITATESGLGASAFARSIPPAEPYNFLGFGYDVLVIVYPKTFLSPNFEIELSNTLLPIDAIDANVGKFYLGAGEDLSPLSTDPLDIAGCSVSFNSPTTVIGNKVSFTVPFEQAELSDDWKDYAIKRFVFINYFYSLNLMQGKTVSFKLTKVGTWRLGNQSHSIYIP